MAQGAGVTSPPCGALRCGCSRSLSHPQFWLGPWAALGKQLGQPGGRALLAENPTTSLHFPSPSPFVVRTGDQIRPQAKGRADFSCPSPETKPQACCPCCPVVGELYSRADLGFLTLARKPPHYRLLQSLRQRTRLACYLPPSSAQGCVLASPASSLPAPPWEATDP